MNILPLILALVLVLSVLTVERFEKFKNQTAIQKQYQMFLQKDERQAFNWRQQRLFGESQSDIKQLSFRFLVDKTAREKNESVAKQYRLLIKELIKILYGNADFFKQLKNKRAEEDDEFIDQLFKAIEEAANEAEDKLIRRVEDIARLQLKDPVLHEAFYHMLKGSISREQLKDLESSNRPFKKGKAYVSLLNFINYDGKDGKMPIIEVQHTPYEVLRAIFGSDEIAKIIITKRQELADSKTDGASDAFANEFKGKRRPGIEDQLLNFKITSGADLTEYD
jgi:hypothetical protein